MSPKKARRWNLSSSSQLTSSRLNGRATLVIDPTKSEARSRASVFGPERSGEEANCLMLRAGNMA